MGARAIVVRAVISNLNEVGVPVVPDDRHGSKIIRRTL